MKTVGITVIIILFLSSTKGNCTNNDSLINHIFKLIYNEQFEQAHQALSNSGDFRNTLYADILLIDLNWWEYVKTKKRPKRKHLTEIIDRFTQSENNGQQKVKQLIGKSYQIRLELARYNIVGAAISRAEIKQLLAQIDEGKNRHPNDQIKLFNLYNLLFIYFDNLMNPFFSEDKKAKRANALKLLNYFTTDEDLIVRTLACYFVGKIYLNIENDPLKSRPYFEFLSTKFPLNSVFSELLSESKNES